MEILEEHYMNKVYNYFLLKAQANNEPGKLLLFTFKIFSCQQLQIT